MFKRFVLGLLISLGLALPIVTVGVMSPAYATWTCRNKLDRGSVVFPDGEEVYVNIIYTFCYQAGSYGKVKVQYSVNSYDFNKARISCDPIFRNYDGVKVNWYFYRPYTGENYNPPELKIPCDESAHNSKTQSYSNAPWLEFGPGWGPDRQPRWKAVVTLQKNGSRDKHGMTWGKFRPNS